jgi:RND family efflux transporter MFP subunit
MAVNGQVRAESRAEGFTEPYRQIELAVGEPGVLTKVLVEEGSRVQPGQIVARLDTLVLERTLEIARQRSEFVGALRAAEAELELRTSHLQKLSQLRDRGHATQQELDRAATDLKVAEARVAMAHEELALQRLECQRIEAQIEHRVVRSPIQGVVSHLWHEEGESFLSSDPRVATIVQLNRLKAKFPLDPDSVVTLKVGQDVRLTIDTNTANVSATVESISPVMDAKSATFEVTVGIDNAKETIPSGARCWLEIPSTQSEGTAAIRSSNADLGGR